jgi:hypothetical protein
MNALVLVLQFYSAWLALQAADIHPAFTNGCELIVRLTCIGFRGL